VTATAGDGLKDTGRPWVALLRTGTIVFVVSLLVCEIGLQLIAASPASTLLEPPPLWIDGRGNPRHPDHDARGYRNTETLATADVVAIGDSHTYGIGVKRHEAWPAILAAQTGLTVYSMAHGGYGPGQYERMLPEALTLRPRAIIVAVYMGNDLYDAFAFAKGTPMPRHLADLAEGAAARDKAGRIEEQAGRLFSLGGGSPIRGWLGEHVELYRLAHRVRRQIAGPPAFMSPNFDEAVMALTPTHRRYVSAVYGPEWRTILRPAYGHLGVDQSDPRILLGFELTVTALQTIAERCRMAAIAFVILVLPTKESVFYPRIAKPADHPLLRELVNDESAFRGRLVRRLRDSGVDTLDLLPALRVATTQPYPESLDGHPNVAGHLIIAERVAGWLPERVPRKTAAGASGSVSGTWTRTRRR
jgi:lysophospholipase L1-like esterase